MYFLRLQFTFNKGVSEAIISCGHVHPNDVRQGFYSPVALRKLLTPSNALAKVL